MRVPFVAAALLGAVFPWALTLLAGSLLFGNENSLLGAYFGIASFFVTLPSNIFRPVISNVGVYVLASVLWAHLAIVVLNWKTSRPVKPTWLSLLACYSLLFFILFFLDGIGVLPTWPD
jgi:hypothetical protein